jgi:hypothetical protein
MICPGQYVKTYWYQHHQYHFKSLLYIYYIACGFTGLPMVVHYLYRL